MNHFIDRDDELQTLNNEYCKPESSLVIVYGRLRVGKTSLVSEFTRGKDAFRFLATRESAVQNRENFRLKAGEFLKDSFLSEAQNLSWDLIFRALMRKEQSGKLVIVMDEFQYIGMSDPSFPSVLQRIWDEQLKNANIMLVLCGSLITLMEKQTLAYSSPLYGRRTAQIRLKQLPFRHYHEFFPSCEYRDLVERYSITGGVPRYIQSFSSGGDLMGMIRNHILNRNSYLYEEPIFLLQQEVSEIGSYFTLIRTIAAGNTKLSDISASLGIKATSLSKYLKTLSDLELLEREVPVTEENPEKSKKGLYRIKDNYLKFWFLFVYPYRDLIEAGNLSIVETKIRSELISRHTAYVYEAVCREKLWDLNGAGIWPFVFTKVGRFWNSKQEIDIVALDPAGDNIILGECKYHKTPVGMDVFLSLKEKAPCVTWRNQTRKEWFVLFSISGFTKELEAYASEAKNLTLLN